MASYPRLMLPFAAVIGVATALSMAAPVSAAEATFGAGEVAIVAARAASPVVRRTTSQRTRLAASRNHERDRYVSQIRSNQDCSGVWCGRQFVLIIGIAY